MYRWRKLRTGSVFFFLPFYRKLPSTSTTLINKGPATTLTTSAPTTIFTDIQSVASNQKHSTVDSSTIIVKTTQTPTESMTPHLLTQSTTRPAGAWQRWSQSHSGYWLGLSASELHPDVYIEETRTLTPKIGQDTIKEKERIHLNVEKKASVPSVYCW
jgi:hypothetical protein